MTETDAGGAGLADVRRRAMEHVGLGLFRYRMDGTLLALDRAAMRVADLEELFAEPAELVGRNLEDLIVYTGEVGRLRNLLRSEGRVQGLEYPFRTLTGKDRWARHDSFLVRDTERDEEVVQAVVMDITDQREAELERQRIEKRMQHAQRLESLGLLAGGIAHDFNNLLVAVLGNADMALMEMAPESPARDAVESIRDAAIRAAELTNQLLAYSGKGRLAVQALDVNRLIEEMAHLFKVSLGSGAALQTDLAAGLPPVAADPAGLQQVLLNLVTNAAEAIGGAGGTIGLRTRLVEVAAGELPGPELEEPLPGGRYVSLAVSDDGCGIAGHDLERLFEPFYTTKFTGRGLGLAAVAGIVRSHGGSIRVDSQPGCGSTFEVLLPAGEETAARRPPPAGCDFTGSGLVLVIDDEPAVHQVAEAMLRRLGFDVIHAHNGRSGWEQVAERGQELVLVLLDLTMPGTNGERTFGEIRRLRPGLPVVLCSGYGRSESVGRFGDRAPDGFMQKPFDIDRLARVLQQVLAASGGPAGGETAK